MGDFQHTFNRVEDYLHHRPPYLLVDEIVEIDATRVVTRSTVRADAFFVAGHFPGAPVLPGAMMQEMTTQTAGILIAAKFNPMPRYNTTDPFFNEYALGVLVRIHRARYRNFARPGDRLTIEVELIERVKSLFDFRGKVSVAGRKLMDNGFQLTNIRSTVLQGTD